MMRGTKYGFENDKFEIEDDDNDESYKNEDDDEEEEEAEDTAEENTNNAGDDSEDDDDDENDEDHKPGRSGRRKTRGTGTRGRGRGRGRGSRGGRGSRAGRPRNNSNNGNSRQQATSEEQSSFLDALLSLGQAMLLKPEQDGADKGTDANADAPTKRKRGRPKKVAQENASEAPSIAPAPDTLTSAPIISNSNNNSVDQDKMDEDAHFNNIAQILAQAPTILAQKMEETKEETKEQSPRPASSSQHQAEMEAVAAILNTQAASVKKEKKPRKKRVLENRMLTERQQMKMLKQIYPNMEISSSSSEDEQSTGSEEEDEEEEEEKKPEKPQEKQQQQQPRRRQRKSLKDSNDESDDDEEEEKKSPATTMPTKTEEKKPQRRGRKPKAIKKEEEKKPTTNGRAPSPERKPSISKPAAASSNATTTTNTTTMTTNSTPASKSTAAAPQPVWIDCGKTMLKCRDVTVGIVNVYKKDAKLDLQTTDSLNINKRIPLDKLLLIAPTMLNMLYFEAPSVADREKLEQIYAALLRDNMAGVVSLPDCLLLFIPYKSKLMTSLEVKDDKRLMGAVFRLHEEGKVVLKSEPAPIKNEEKPVAAAPPQQQQPAVENASAPTLPPPEVMSILSSLNLSSDQMNNVLGLMQKVGVPATAPTTTTTTPTTSSMPQQAIRTTSPNTAMPYAPPAPAPITPTLATSLPIQPPAMQQQSPMMAHHHHHHQQQQSPMQQSPMQPQPYMQAPLHHSPMQSPVQQHPAMMDYRRPAAHPSMPATHMIDSTQTLHPAPPQPHNIGVPPPPVGVPPPPSFGNFLPGGNIGVPPPPQSIIPNFGNQLPTRAQSPGLKRKREDDDLSPDAKKRRLYQDYDSYDMQNDQDRASRSPSPGYMNDGYNSSVRGGRRNGPPHKFRRDYEYSGYANKFGNYGRDYNQQQQQGYARHDNYVRYSNRPQQQQQQQHQQQRMYRDTIMLNDKQDYYKSAPAIVPGTTTTTTTTSLPNSSNPSMVQQDSNRYQQQQHHSYPYFDKKQNYDRFTEQQTPTRHLWIGRFNRNLVDYDTIMQDFSKYGEVESCNYLRDQKCAFVNFKRLEDAERAKRHLEGAKYPKVEFQRSKPPKDIKDSSQSYKKFGTAADQQQQQADDDMDTS